MPRQRKGPVYNLQRGGLDGPPVNKPPVHSAPHSPPPLFPDNILQFLNALPTTGHCEEWISLFQNSLLQLFDGDVDCVEIHVDIRCKLSSSNLLSTDSSSDEDAPPLKVSDGGTGSGVSGTARNGPSDLLLDDFQTRVYPEEEYHPPAVYDYHFDGGRYLGTILLLRKRSHPPISEQSLLAMEALEPFLIFALSDMVARHVCAKPIGYVFNDVLQEIAWQTRLTQRELQVLTLHMFGRKYEEIARRLYISIDTVKKHVKRVHRKTGARSAMELFARYFTPLIDLEEVSDDEDEG